MSLSLSRVRGVPCYLNSGTGQLLSDSGAGRLNDFAENLADPLGPAVDLHPVDVLDVVALLRHARGLEHLRQVRL